jgi:hypothetical protein
MVGESVLTTCHVLNRVSTKNSEITSYEEWKGRKPSLHYMRMCGCLAMVSVPINKKRKLGPKIVGCILLGYAHHIMTSKFLVINQICLIFQWIHSWSRGMSLSLRTYSQ